MNDVQGVLLSTESREPLSNLRLATIFDTVLERRAELGAQVAATLLDDNAWLRVVNDDNKIEHVGSVRALPPLRVLQLRPRAEEWGGRAKRSPALAKLKQLRAGLAR
jgi:hypothetical protein